MTIELEEVKQYLRISHTFDDDYITALIDMSLKFIAEQTGVEYTEDDLTYKQAVLYTVAHFYDKRESISEKNEVINDYTMDYLIKHIGIRRGC